jgi:two-component system cell cycle sensor histidine kinase/response regulator CckA
VSRPLRVLLVEDSEDDAELVMWALRRGGYDLTSERVQTGPAMAAALDRNTWDVIISDYSMPEFDAPRAFALFQTKGVDIPFIIVSGTVGEDTAVAAMRLGVHDYFLKGKLTRLVPAIERELRDSADRQARRQAESSAAATEAKFQRLVEGAPDAIVIVDRQGRIVLVNSQTERLFGYDRKHLLGKPVEVLLPERFRRKHPWHREEHVQDLQVRQVGSGIELSGLGANGVEFPIEVCLSPLETEDGVLVSSTIRDIRKRKHLEEQFRQAQKMEAVGQLAGGVAHDFNNVLTVILSYTRLVLAGLKPGDPLVEDVQEVQRAAERAVELTRQLLAFSRKQVLVPRVIDLNAIVVGMEGMLRRLVTVDIELSLLPPDGAGRVHADPSQIEQVVMNLVVNAGDAMPHGGKVTIETRNVDLGESYAAAHDGVVPGPYVMLAVTDSGTGMDPATQARIFEPFFTTKEIGKGTGLGLSMVFGIVKQSAGHLWVESDLGKGTTFKVYLPRTDRTAEPAPSTTDLSTALLRGTETILLVEDDEQVRKVTYTILRRQGYNVLEAQNGGEAFLVCEKHTAKIDLLLTDVVMPRMSGRQLAERLSPMRPLMKVLYMSGYTDDSVIHHGVLDSDVAFLQKPMEPESLLRKVREVLDGKAR